jgi:hypothetical protein
MRQRMAQGLATNQNFADGVRDAFPLLSIKGKVFRARVAGQETAFIDPQTRQPIPFLDVVMVNASRTLAKTYFIKGYTEGDLNPPDCWSLDSVRPDASVLNKVSMSCVSCPMNQFGSRVTDAGKPAKACQDARRVAVVLPHMLNSKDPLVMMLRVPQSSLKNLKAYAQLLERHGIDPVGVVTRMAFDYALDVAYPKLIFNFVNVLDDASYTKVIELSASDMVNGMLKAPDFTEIQTPTSVQNPQPVGMVPQTGPVLEDPQVLGQAPVSSVQPMPQQAQAAMQATQAPVQATQVPVQATQVPVQATQAPVQTAGMIELPEGRWYNPVTKEIIEAAPAPVKQVDPRVIALPQGQFFHMDRKVYVTGDEVGAPEVNRTVTGVPAQQSLGQPNPGLQVQQPQQVAMAPVGQAGQVTQPAPKATRTRATRKMAPQQAIQPQPQQETPNDQAQQLAAAVGQITGGAVETEDSGGNDVVQNGGDAPGKAPVNAAPGDLESILKALLPTNPQ